MRFVDEPADRVESELQREQVTVKREPYNPRNRSLLSDFVGFLRTPDAGSTVTLFEDDDGRVRYYTVERPDPEVQSLRTRVEELDQVRAPDEARLGRIEARLERIAELEAKVATLPELEERVARIPALEEKVTAVDRLPALEEKVAAVEKLGAKVKQIDALSTRLERLERP
jgi:hypothetical protein